MAELVAGVNLFVILEIQFQMKVWSNFETFNLATKPVLNVSVFITLYTLISHDLFNIYRVY